MKWLYITVIILGLLSLFSIMQDVKMYTNKGIGITPIHMGVDNGK